MKTELCIVILSATVIRAAKEITIEKQFEDDFHHHMIPFGPEHFHHLFHHLPLYKYMGILPYLYTELSVIFFIKVKAAILVGAFIFFLKYFGYYYYRYYKSKFHHHSNYKKIMYGRSIQLTRKIINEIDEFTEI